MRDRTNFHQSTASENCGGKRDQKSLFDREPVTSQDAITLENNEKFWLQVDRENAFAAASGGEGGIRTHGGRKPTTVFETAPIDHSGTSPRLGVVMAAGFSRVLSLIHI